MHIVETHLNLSGSIIQKPSHLGKWRERKQWQKPLYGVGKSHSLDTIVEHNHGRQAKAFGQSGSDSIQGLHCTLQEYHAWDRLSEGWGLQKSLAEELSDLQVSPRYVADVWRWHKEDILDPLNKDLYMSVKHKKGVGKPRKLSIAELHTVVSFRRYPLSPLTPPSIDHLCHRCPITSPTSIVIAPPPSIYCSCHHCPTWPPPTTYIAIPLPPIAATDAAIHRVSVPPLSNCAADTDIHRAVKSWH